MNITPTPIKDILLIEPDVHGDDRGWFMETYQSIRYAKAGIPSNFVQDNQSGSRQGILRGLHYQIRQPQGKLVRVVAGEIFDVAVDIRRSSPTLGQWVGVILSAKAKNQIWVPVGFAHGFYVLSEWAEIIYKATDFYSPENERTLLWNDPQINIQWPLAQGAQPILSAKDASGTPFAQAELFE